MKYGYSKTYPFAIGALVGLIMTLALTVFSLKTFIFQMLYLVVGWTVLAFIVYRIDKIRQNDSNK